jgi:hypothetical protein
MNKLGFNLGRLALAVAALAASTLAAAGVRYVGFEGTPQAIYSNGDNFVDAGLSMMTLGQGGLDGAVVDSAGCFLVACPSGNAGQFYTGLNDGGLKISAFGALMNLTSLDFAFVLPVPQLVAGSVGALVLAGIDAGGAVHQITRDFGLQDGNGEYVFETWNFASSFSAIGFSSLTVRACLFDGAGGCVNPANNQAQFAVDNIGLLPEPASVALVGVSLFGLLAAGRRRKSV